MAVTTKRKVGVKKETVTVRRERLRLRDWMLFWILVLANVALVCAIFGNIDVNTLKPVGSTSSTGASATELDALKAELQTKLDNFDKNYQLDVQQKTFSDRIELTDELLYANATEFCGDLAINEMPANQSVKYTDSETGVSFEVPYNEAWGYQYCYLSLVTKYDITDYGTSTIAKYAYGPTGTDRLFELTVSKATTEAKFNAELKARMEAVNDGPTTEYRDVRRRTISGMAVIDVQHVGSPHPVHCWDAIGRNYHYTLCTPTQWHDTTSNELLDKEVIKVIQSLRVTN